MVASRTLEGSDFPPTTMKVRVAAGHLHVAVWGKGPRTVLGIHGVTASSMSLLPVARRLPPDFALVAPDLRGRGHSASLPGPYGMRAHAEDCAEVIKAVADGPVVVLGESMGAYVAVALAAVHPELVERLVLVDSGLPVPFPEQFGDKPDLDAAMAATLGPALARLSMVFAAPKDYLDFWRAHPALKRDWNPDIEVYVMYDLEAIEGGYRSRVKAEAVRDDSRDLLELGTVGEALAALSCDVALVRAPRDLVDRPMPLIPDEVVAEWQRRLPNLSAMLVDDVNHYTLMFGERGAETIAALVAGGGQQLRDDHRPPPLGSPLKEAGS